MKAIAKGKTKIIFNLIDHLYLISLKYFEYNIVRDVEFVRDILGRCLAPCTSGSDTTTVQ